MSDATSAPSGAPETEGDAPSTGPLTPVFLVWPGKNFSQTWVLFWLGVAYVIGGLLPWYGSGADTVVLENGRELSLSGYQLEVDLNSRRPDEYSKPDKIVDIIPRSISFGAVMTLLFGIGMVLSGLKNLWNRRLVLWPVTLAWFVILVAVFYTKAEWVDPGRTALQVVQNGGSQLGEVMSNLGGWFSGPDSADHQALVAIVNRYDIGFYVTALVQVFLVLFIIGSVVVGVMTAKKEGQGGGGGGSKPRPSGGAPKRRPGNLPGGNSSSSSDGDDA